MPNTYLIALDPGNAQTGVVTYNPLTRNVVGASVMPNDDLLANLRTCDKDGYSLAVEMIASYGMAVGREVFDTCVWIGRFVEAWGKEYRLVYRRDVKTHLCGSVRANDSNIRTAILDRYGGKEKAVGKKADPGPLYGVKSHCWPALAVAITASEVAHVDAP